MPPVISCRTGVFGPVATAFEYFPQAGVCHAEAPTPQDGDYAALAALAARHGVTIASMSAQLNVATEEAMEPFQAVVDGAHSIGVPRLFVSAKTADDVPHEVTVQRLRSLADYAHRHDVTICMETHPPLGENGDKAKKTLDAVDHPGLRFNFDTANVYYYNEGTDTITELKKVAQYVASVHLKDTDGGFKSPNFPPLGQGIVDFKGVFDVLRDVNFEGPYTLEIEGANVSGLDAQGRLEFLRTCVAFLHDMGAVK